MKAEDSDMKLINDPLQKLSDTSMETEVVSSDMDTMGDESLFERVVRVPIEVSEEEIRNKTPLKVMIDITVT